MPCGKFNGEMVSCSGFAAKSLTVMIDAEKSQISKNNEFNDKLYRGLIGTNEYAKLWARFTEEKIKNGYIDGQQSC